MMRDKTKKLLTLGCAAALAVLLLSGGESPPMPAAAGGGHGGFRGSSRPWPRVPRGRFHAPAVPRLHSSVHAPSGNHSGHRPAATASTLS